MYPFLSESKFLPGRKSAVAASASMATSVPRRPGIMSTGIRYCGFHDSDEIWNQKPAPRVNTPVTRGLQRLLTWTYWASAAAVWITAMTSAATAATSAARPTMSSGFSIVV